MKNTSTFQPASPYLLEWLDMIIMLTLNPAKTNVETITPKQAGYLTEELDKEVVRLKYQLKNKLFSLTQQCEIRLFTNHYYYALTALLDYAMENGKHAAFKRKDLAIVHQKLLSCLNELLSFIETHLTYYLSKDERVPVTYLEEYGEELSRNFTKVKKRLGSLPADEAYLQHILITCFEKIISNIERKEKQRITFREVSYHRELLKSIEEQADNNRISTCYTLLEEILIGMNFNHRDFINGITRKIKEKVNRLEYLKDRIDLLLLCRKELKQLIPKPDKYYHSEEPSLHITMDNWLNHELDYAEKQQRDIVPAHSSKTEERQQEWKDSYKLLCSLSEDQLGIILKAADDLQIIISRSLSNVFNQIVPFLSTPYKKELSADSMRSHTYNIEEKDKKVVIENLQNMIERIKEY